MLLTHFIIFGCFVLITLLLTGLENVSTPMSGGENRQVCKFNYENSKKCFYGTISFQNCQGQFLTVDKPFNRVVWKNEFTQKACFLITRPVTESYADLYNLANHKYIASIESTFYKGHYLRTDSNGEVTAEDLTNKGVNTNKKRGFLFQFEQGLSGEPYTVSLRTVDNLVPNSCCLDDGVGLKSTPYQCPNDILSRQKASFYIGMSLNDYSWWWKKTSLFDYPDTYTDYTDSNIGGTLARVLANR